MLACLFRHKLYGNPNVGWAFKQLGLPPKFRPSKYGHSRFYSNLKLNSSHSLNWKMNRTFNEFLNYTRKYHATSSLLCDLPDYLKEIASKVPDLQEDVLEGLELENNMEDEICEFLLSRAISYEELEGSFIVICPSCGQSDKTHDMFVDKNSGYCVCPWCCWDGCWDDLIKLFDAKEDCLVPQQLENYFLNVNPIEESHLPFLSSSPLKGLDLGYLKAVGTGITEDLSKIIFPLKGENDERVGFASMSLLHPMPKIVKRILEGRSAIFAGIPLPQTKRILKKVVIVSDIFDAIHLAQLRIYSLVIISDPKPKLLSRAFQNFRNVIIWAEFSQISPNLLLYLSLKRINSYAVRLTNNQPPLSMMPEAKISKLISDAMPILSDAIISFHDMRNKVYDRVINKEEMFGIKWTRFSELNQILMGHREGELTVFSGQTGSGKTTFMSEYSLDLSMQGVPTLWGSFEVNVSRLCEIMLQQFSGGALPEDYSEFKKLADKFAELPIYFLNNHGQQPIKDVINTMTEAVLIKGVRHIVIDNLQFMLGLHGANADWWLEQDRAVGAFRQFATAYNCHVTLIVHPRKLNIGERLNLHSISGGARVTQEADNVLILHVKENKDGSSNYNAPKTLQIAKNRYGGTLGEMRLRFHKESLTLSSCFRNIKNDFVEVDPHSSEESISENLETLSDVKGIPSLHLHR